MGNGSTNQAKRPSGKFVYVALSEKSSSEIVLIPLFCMKKLISSLDSSADYVERPNANLLITDFVLFTENTIVSSTWTDYEANKTDINSLFERYNRIINNVTLSMPHTVLYSAANDAASNIMQPEDLDGLGAYTIRGALPSPYINVLCVNAQRDNIEDLVFESVGNTTLNPLVDLPWAYTNEFNWTAFSDIKTPLDDIFGWDAKNADLAPPIFYKFPMPFNTVRRKCVQSMKLNFPKQVLNNTATYGRDAVYLLGFGAMTMDTTANDEYLICNIKAGLRPDCPNIYCVSSSGSKMSVECRDPTDPMAYKNQGNTSRIMTTSLDWFGVATSALGALSLNDGVTDGNTSNARILMESMLQEAKLNPSLPSPAEAIAVMLSPALLMSIADSPLVEYWVGGM
jgi:hypothetical protein